MAKKKSTTKPREPRVTVKQIQQDLVDRGYRIEVTGKMDSRTEAAMLLQRKLTKK